MRLCVYFLLKQNNSGVRTLSDRFTCAFFPAMKNALQVFGGISLIISAKAGYGQGSYGQGSYDNYGTDRVKFTDIKALTFRAG